MRLHRSNLFRIFLVLFIVFMLSFLAYYNVWLEANQTVTISAPKNYVFLKNDSNPLKIDSELVNTVDIVTYGNGLRLNGLFETTPTFVNETIIGHLYVEKEIGNSTYSHVGEFTVSNQSGIFNLELNLTPGAYRIVAFEDLYFTGYNYSMELNVINQQPGSTGTVVALMPFPWILFITMAVSGTLSAMTFSYVVLNRKRQAIGL